MMLENAGNRLIYPLKRTKNADCLSGLLKSKMHRNCEAGRFLNSSSLGGNRVIFVDNHCLGVFRMKRSNLFMLFSANVAATVLSSW